MAQPSTPRTTSPCARSARNARARNSWAAQTAGTQATHLEANAEDRLLQLVVDPPADDGGPQSTVIEGLKGMGGEARGVSRARMHPSPRTPYLHVHTTRKTSRMHPSPLHALTTRETPRMYPRLSLQERNIIGSCCPCGAPSSF